MNKELQILNIDGVAYDISDKKSKGRFKYH